MGLLTQSKVKSYLICQMESCSLTIKPIHTEEGGWDYGEFKLLGSMGYDTLSDWVEGTASYL